MSVTQIERYNIFEMWQRRCFRGGFADISLLCLIGSGLLMGHLVGLLSQMGFIHGLVRRNFEHLPAKRHNDLGKILNDGFFLRFCLFQFFHFTEVCVLHLIFWHLMSRTFF